MPRNAAAPESTLPRMAPSLSWTTGCCVISLIRFSVATFARYAARQLTEILWSLIRPTVDRLRTEHSGPAAANQSPAAAVIVATVRGAAGLRPGEAAVIHQVRAIAQGIDIISRARIVEEWRPVGLDQEEECAIGRNRAGIDKLRRARRVLRGRIGGVRSAGSNRLVKHRRGQTPLDGQVGLGQETAGGGGCINGNRRGKLHRTVVHEPSAIRQPINRQVGVWVPGCGRVTRE